MLVATVALGVTVVGRSPADARPDQRDRAALVADGRALYRVGCVSCHGADGEGVAAGDGQDRRGPSLRSSGEAAAYYYLSTGRMPLGNPDDEPHRKDPAYGRKDLDALVAYVGTLGDGPDLPVLAGDPDVAAGGAVFRGNCQACHSATGAGGALSYGRAAPNLAHSEPSEVAAAVRTGPGQMPVFLRNEIDDQALSDVVAYVQELRNPQDAGGLPIGRIGPVPEGFVAWAVGIVLLLSATYWIGTRSPIRRPVVPDGPVGNATPDPEDHG